MYNESLEGELKRVRCFDDKAKGYRLISSGNPVNCFILLVIIIVL